MSQLPHTRPDPPTASIPTPRPAPELFGREELLKDLVALTRARTPLAIYGLPGAGKTALALALANEPLVAASFPAGRAWIDAGPHADAFQLLGAALVAFGIAANELKDVESRAAALRALLHESPALLIVDDIWRVDQAQLIIEACQRPASVVLTMRARQLADDLKLADIAAPPLAEAPALEMLATGGRYAGEAGAAVAADPAGAAALAESLGRLPLALHVATRYLNQVARSEGAANAIAAVRTDLAQHLLDWTASAARLGTTESEPSLDAVIALSYDRLPPATATALCQLGVFGGQPITFSVAAAEAVWGVDGAAARQLRLQLVDAGLLEPAPAKDGAMRYSLHPVIAHFAGHHLATDAAAQRAATLAHAAHYAAIVGGWDNAIDAGGMTYAAPLEWENVVVAVERLAAATDDHEMAAALLAFARQWRNVLYNNHNPRRLDWLNAAESAAHQVDDDWTLANVLKAQGDVLAFLDERTAALAKYDQALALFQAVGARLGEANVLKAQGDVLAFLDERTAALAKYDQALALFQAVGDRLGEANVLKAQGDVLAFLDERTAALAKYDQALALFQAVGDRLGEANVLKAQGDVLAFLDERTAALAKYDQALALFQAVGDRLGEANVLKAQGDVLAFLDERTAALAKYDQALALFQAVGARLGEANVLKAQGDVLAFLDERTAALAKYDQALALFQAVGARLGEANVLKAQGDAALKNEEIEQGMALLEAARQLYVAIGARVGQANVGINLARHAAAQGDLAAAVELMQPAADFGKEIGHPLGEALQAEIDGWQAQITT